MIRKQNIVPKGRAPTEAVEDAVAAVAAEGAAGEAGEGVETAAGAVLASSFSQLDHIWNPPVDIYRSLESHV